MNRLLAMGLGAVLVLGAVRVLAASPLGPHYAGEWIDGFLVDGQRSCAMPPGDDCEPQLAVALAQLTPEERSAVSAAAIGSEPGSYWDISGRQVFLNRAGLTNGYPVILDFAGKPRRVIPLECGWMGSATGGTLVSSCVYAPDSLLRVGDFPKF